MINYDIFLKCGQPSVKRLTWLKNTTYKLSFKIFDTDGTPLDTVQSWKGRIAEAWIGDNKVFYTGNPEHLNTQQSISESVIIDLKFGGDRWTLHLIASDVTMKIEPSQGELPTDISCTTLQVSDTLTSSKARINEFLPGTSGLVKFSTGSGLVTFDKEGGILVGDSIRDGSFVLQNQIRTPGNVYANNAYLSGDLSASSLLVVESEKVGSGAVNAQNVFTSGAFTNIMRCDELARFNGSTEFNSKVTIDTDGELQLNDGTMSMNGSTEIYCPTPKKDGGVTRYSPTVQFLEPPVVQEAGHYLLFKRVYD